MAANLNLKSYIDYVHFLSRDKYPKNYKKLTLKDIASDVGVTPATLSNLNTESKVLLVRDVCYVIYTYYYDFYQSCTLYSVRMSQEDGEIPLVQNQWYIMDELLFAAEHDFGWWK